MLLLSSPPTPPIQPVHACLSGSTVPALVQASILACPIMVLSS